jgi:hypothetical protein
MKYIFLILGVGFFSVSHAKEPFAVILNGKPLFKIQRHSKTSCNSLIESVAEAGTRLAQEEFDACMTNNPFGKVTEANRPQIIDICLITYEGKYKLPHKIVIEEKLKKEGCESQVSQ